MSDLDQIKRDLVTASHIIHQQGLVNAFGHISARIPGTDRFLFPPRMSPALVTMDKLLVLDVDGNQHEGQGRPNTEFWIHARIYRARPDVNSVCHNHSPACVALSSLGEPFQAIIHPAASFKHGVPTYDRIGLIRSAQLGDEVARTLGQGRGMLLRGHGSNTAAEDVKRACLLALWIDEACGLQLRAMAAGKPRGFTAEEMELVEGQIFEQGPIERGWEYFSSLVEDYPV